MKERKVYVGDWSWKTPLNTRKINDNELMCLRQFLTDIQLHVENCLPVGLDFSPKENLVCIQVIRDVTAVDSDRRRLRSVMIVSATTDNAARMENYRYSNARKRSNLKPLAGNHRENT